MEEHKRLKPFFSQAADRLNERIIKLIGGAWSLQDDPHDKTMPAIMAQSLDGTDGMSLLGTIQGTDKQLPSIIDGRDTPQDRQ